MHSKLFQELQLSMEPVAIFFTDEKPENAMQFREGERGCVGSVLIAAAKGKTAVFDRKTYGCPGGGVGLGFGDTYGTAFPVDCIVSTGDEALARLGKENPYPLGRGLRFFASPELAEQSRRSFPYADIPQKYVVFRPFSEVNAGQPPALICIFANPDQLSCLVIMGGFHRGGTTSVAAPSGAAACQSIVYAYHEMHKESPQAILGFFDISQRSNLAKEMLSFTVPFALYQEMEDSVDDSCLTTDSWKKLASRM